MKRIPKDQHRMILTEIYVKSKPYMVKIVLNNQEEIVGRITNIEDVDLTIGNTITDFFSIDEVYIIEK